MATERIIIQVDEKGARVVSRNLAAVGTTAKTAGSQVKFLRTALVALGATVILRSAINTLASFGQEMSTVRAITQATETEFKSLQETARTLGTTTRFTATQAAEGMTFLARAGFTTNQVLASISDTLNLAQAGALDLASAADISSNVLQGFGLDASEAGRVVDVLAFAASNSNTNILQLGDALKFVAPVAKAAGVSLEEAAAAVGTLSNAGIQASLAGTGLRQSLIKLSAPTAAAKKALKELGLSARDVNPRVVGLSESFKILGEAGLTLEQAVKIFDVRTASAALAFASAGDAAVKFAGRIEKAEGTALRIARTMDQNLNGALLAVKSAAEGVVLAFGELGASDFLTNFFFRLAKIIRTVADNADRLGRVILAGVVVAGFKVATIAAIAFTTAIRANPIILLVTVITAAVAAVIAFADEINVAKSGFISLRDLAIVVFSTLLDGFKAIGSAFSLFLNSIFGSVGPAFKEIEVSFEGFLRFVARGFDALLGLAIGTVFGIVAAFKELTKVIGSIFFSISIEIAKIFNVIIKKLVKQINSFIALASIALSKIPGIRVAIPLLKAPELEELEDNFRTGFGNIGEAGAAGFSEGFKSSRLAETVLDDILDKAQERAAERIQKRFNEASAGFAGAVPTAPLTDPSATGGRTTESMAISSQAMALERLNKELMQELELAGLSVGVREQRRQILDIENDLIKEGIDLKSQDAILALESARSIISETQELTKRQAILDELEGPERDRQERIRIINELIAEGTGNQALLNKELERLRDGLEENKEFGEQFNDVFVEAGKIMENLGTIIAQKVLGAINRASDALAEFAISGFQNVDDLREAFANLFRDLAKQILSLIIRILILKALQASTGIGVPVPTTTAATGGPVGGLQQFQAGGVPPRRQPVIVGERGTEVFVPQGPGNIIPNSQLQLAPEVNISVVNVTDPDEAIAAINTSEGERAVLNILSKNPSALRQILQR